jgi:hypothetical protein
MSAVPFASSFSRSASFSPRSSTMVSACVWLLRRRYPLGRSRGHAILGGDIAVANHDCASRACASPVMDACAGDVVSGICTALDLHS